MRRDARGILVLLMVFLAWPAAAGDAGRSLKDQPLARALAFFEPRGASSIPEFLGRLRPAPLSPAARAQVIASLPREGELQPSPAEWSKLAAVDAVLALHDRTGAVEVKLIDVQQAFVGLYARTALLFSRRALALVTAEEVRALAGHELGHEYVWNEYQAATASASPSRLQELELVCDGIAVMSLRELGLDPAHLISAVTKLTRYNESLRAVANARSYVTLDERRRFVEALPVPYR